MMFRKIINLALLLLCNSMVYAQLDYIGLKSESNVRDAQNLLSGTGTYWPKTQVIDSFLYIPTTTGIFQKNLNSNDTLWSLYAFGGIPIRDFVKKGDSLLAITAFTTDSLTLLSTDGGVSYINNTSPHFFSIDPNNIVWNIDQNPTNRNSLIILEQYGVSKSYDYGNTWDWSQKWAGGYQEWFVGFSLLDTCSLYYTGEQMFYESYIQVSNDNGLHWMLTGNIHNHATHVLAFHPIDTNIIISGGEGLIGKSYDRGQTWTYTDTLPLYITDIKYDPNSINTLYATGDFHGINDTIEIYRSTDNGNNWEVFHKEYIPNSDGALELHIFKNKLYIYTLVNGVYSLDIGGSTSIFDNQNKIELNIFPNPTNNDVYIECGEVIDEIIVIDALGKPIEQFTPNSKIHKINCSDFSSGIYLLKIETEKGTVSKKIEKK